MSTKPYWVTISERRNPGRKIEARLGLGSGSSGAPTPSAGGGGWQTVVLPKRSAVSVWQGRDQLLLMTVPIILGDGPGGPNFAAASLATVLRMWRPDDPTDEPPVIKLNSPGNAVPFQQIPWVLSDFAWNNSSGDVQGDELANRTLTGVTLSLLEYRADEKLQVAKIKAKKKHKSRGKHRVKKGETLTKIAANYGVLDWRSIGDIQVPPIQDPRQIVVGQQLEIPAP